MLSEERQIAGKAAPLKVEKNTVTDAEMYQRLSGAIADNRLPPGAKLGEGNLAKFFNVSRARVRELLRDLARERLVTILPNRGAFVATPTVEETRQIYEARRAIESAMIAPMIKRITPRQLDALHAKVVEEEQSWARDDRPHAIRCAREFHRSLVQLGGNDILSAALDSILSRGSLATVLYGERHNPGCMCSDHFAIIDAIRSGDVAATERLMLDHLQQIEDRMLLKETPDKVSIEDALRDTK
jgi:DNA-binding GntR family transcriptional regulator